MNTTDKVQVGDSTTGTSTSTTYTVNSKPPIEYGWACPRCGRVNAPWKSQCDCLGGNWCPTWYPWDYKEPWWKQVYCNSDTFKVHPDSTVYQVGGSDYWNPTTKTWENIRSTQTNSIPNSATTAQNTYSTNTIHNGKTNYKE